MSTSKDYARILDGVLRKQEEKGVRDFISGATFDAIVEAFEAEVAAEREASAGEIDRLRTALLRIAFKDRHYRVQKPKPDGGFRGVGGMIAAFALTGVNGSFIGDARIAEQYPDLARAIRDAAASAGPEAAA